ESAGKRVLYIGGNSRMEQFRPAIPGDAKPASRAEASGVSIENCLIINGQIPLAFVNAENCSAQHCTIVRPRGCALALLADQTDPRVTGGRNYTFGSNLIAWEAGDIQRFVEVGKRVSADAIQMQSNLWW